MSKVHSKTIDVPLNTIRAYPPLDKPKIEEFRKLLEQGKHLPPVNLLRHYRGGYVVTDGRHRVAAARLAGWTTIPAKILN